jgi:hypothetical protein
MLGGTDVFLDPFIEILNASENQKTRQNLLRSNLFAPYFCLDTSLSRTLAYVHWCNWGNVLESLELTYVRGLVEKLPHHFVPRPGTRLLPRLNVRLLRGIWNQ